MPSTPDPIAGIQLMALGENLNTWGDPNLNDALKRIMEARYKLEPITVAADVTLDNTDYVENQSRKAGFVLTGDGGFNIICPLNKPRIYLVKNECTAAVTFKHLTGTTVTIPAGMVQQIATDGTNFFSAEPTDFGGNKITNVGTGTEDGDGVNKGQMDAELNDKLDAAGDDVAGLLQYSADFSGSFTDRSLVDKAYVDAVAFGNVQISLNWGDINNKPTDLAGYGLDDDVYSKTQSDERYLRDNIKSQWRLRP